MYLLLRFNENVLLMVFFFLNCYLLVEESICFNYDFNGYIIVF